MQKNTYTVILNRPTGREVFNIDAHSFVGVVMMLTAEQLLVCDSIIKHEKSKK